LKEIAGNKSWYVFGISTLPVGQYSTDSLEQKFPLWRFFDFGDQQSKNQPQHITETTNQPSCYDIVRDITMTSTTYHLPPPEAFDLILAAGCWLFARFED